MVAANMCILRHLEHISSPAFVGNDPDYARRRARFEIVLCIVCPFVFAGCRMYLFAALLFFSKSDGVLFFGGLLQKLSLYLSDSIYVSRATTRVPFSWS